jgi:hypothetical protein
MLHTYKPDWEEARQRLVAWWARERMDRVAALVYAPRAGVAPIPPRDDVPGKYTDAEVVFHNVDARVKTTFFGGEAIPGHWVYLGPIPLGGFLGAELHFAADTTWQSPLYDSWDIDEVPFDPENQWYRLLCNITRESVRRSGGRWLVSGQGFGCVSDVIASLWGSEETLMAMVERPEAVERIARQLTGLSITLYDEVDTITHSHQEGSFDWLALWAPGRMWTLQSDLCCMLSPAMFERFVLDELRREAEHVEHSFYHLDGPGAITHLDALMSIQALDGIQWVPGAGVSNNPLDWIPLFRRVQAAGKKLLIYCQPERVEPLLNLISREGVCLSIGCPDQAGAEAMLRRLERIGM